MIILTNKQEYLSLLKNIDDVPFSQSEGWLEYKLSQKNKVIYLADSKENPTILFFGRLIKVPIFGDWISVEGICKQDQLAAKEIKDAFNSINDLPFSYIEITDVANYSAGFEIGIRQAGFQRPLGTFGSTLSIELPIQEEIKVNRKWKKNIKLSHKQQLIFSVEDNTLSLINTFCEAFEEMASFKGLAYRLNPNEIAVLLNSNDFQLFSVKNTFGEYLSFRIVYVSDAKAYDIYAANSLKSRETGASYFMMENLLNYLKERGVEVFDFGKIAPGSHGGDGVFEFKNSAKGKIIQYNGEWVFAKNKLSRIAVYLLKRYIMRKREY